MSTARPMSFYRRWIDHGRWPEWSPDREWARLDGRLARIWALILGCGFEQSVPADLDRLAHLVETSA